jgi:putative ABC transport system substrate-binding protein
VIAAVGGNLPVLAAKAATTAIPVVFAVGEDPVGLGLVASLARPGGNLTGINFLAAELTAKRLELQRELVPTAVRVAVLVNTANATNAETTLRDVEPAARARGCRSKSSTPAAAARSMRLSQPSHASGPTRSSLAAIPSSTADACASRDFVIAGGLMSYGTTITDAFRQVGVYVGRILKSAKPADLPVAQSTKFELVINHVMARTVSTCRRPCLPPPTR